MTKVCHITNVHPQSDIRIFEKECISLAELGYEVHLVAPGESTNTQNVYIHGIGERPLARRERMTKFAKKAYMEALKINADIYHFHDPELIPYGLKLKNKKKKVIFDSHENILDQFAEKEYIPKMLRVILNGVFVSYLKYACRKFDAIVTVDPIICQKYEVLNSNSVVITNYPEFEQSNDVKAQERYICFAGGISSQWNHDVIINAVERIDNFKYVLCGSADKAYLEYLKTLPGWRNVDYRGKVSHSEALNLLNGGIAGVALCSYSKNTNGKQGTLGNTKLFEIMMSGLPVICTDFGAWSEIVQKHSCGFCMNFRDSQRLTEIINQILDKPEVGIAMGERGCLAIRHEYNWKTQKKILGELYEKIINE